MHRLVPTLITENLSKGVLQGHFSCIALFVDISGFTVVTETLMQHGQHGAEVLAVLMRTIFTPVVQSVYEQGGFVTNYAGDAVTAVFPIDSADQTEIHHRALAAAWKIHQHMTANALMTTRYGDFEFSAKVGLSTGGIEWGTILSPQGRRAIYYFRGSAITGSAHAEKQAHAGDIIAGRAFYDIVAEYVSAHPVLDHWNITTVLSKLPEPLPIDLPVPNTEQQARFYPRFLVENKITGEFRQTLNLFISLQGTPTRVDLEIFIKHVFRLQDKYGGLVNRVDFGDKGCHMLLFWGAPISHENDVTRVMNFILELREVSQIPIRAGITYRIAHAGSIGSSLAEEYTCYGRGVNLAARFMTSADWNEIWVDEQTARRVDAKYILDPLTPKLFKGFAEPQPILLLTGHREDRLSPFVDRPLVGRQEELNRLQNAVRPIYDGQFGGVVTVVGEPGIGKSRLLHAFMDAVSNSGEVNWFLCQTDEIIRQSLNPFRYFLRRYFDQSSMRDERENKNRFGEILTDLTASIHDEDLIEEIERTSSFLGSLVGLYWEDSLYEHLEPELRFENTLTAIKTLFRAESRRQPVIIQLEDAQWLDPDSKEFLDQLTRNMSGFPVILIVTSRIPVADSLFDSLAPKHVINLDPLANENIAELAIVVLGQNPSPSLIELLSERADGNPFYLEQMLLYLLENNLLEAASAEQEATLPGDVYLPVDVRAVVTARLDKLPLPVKEVVQKAAVLGREFEIPILEYMVDHDPQLQSKLETAVGEGIWSALDEANFHFKHALMRDAAYDMQLLSRLRQMHKSAAKAFENQHDRDPDVAPRYPEIAYHFDKAEENIQASHYYGKAGDLAKENYSILEAVSYFSRGLHLAGEADIQTRYSYLCGREMIYQWMGLRSEQQQDLEDLEKLLREHPDDLKQADLALRQSSFALVTGDYGKAITMVENSLTFAQQADQDEVKAKAYHRWGRTLVQQGGTKEAEEHLNHALKLARASGNRAVEADCLVDLVMVYRNLARYDDAKTFLEVAQEAYEELEDKQGLVRCHNIYGVIAIEQGDLDGSLQHYLQALELCRETGWRYGETYIQINIGNSYIDIGDYQNGRYYHDLARSLSIETGDLHAEAVSLDSLGLISYYNGDFSGAEVSYRKALEIRESISNQRSKAYVLTHFGHASAQLGKIKDAEVYFHEALIIRRELNEEALVIDTYSGLALVAYLKEDNNNALGIVDDILSWIKENGVEGLEFPVQVYLICYQILHAAAESEPDFQEAAVTVLANGHALLMERLERIKDEQMRQRFIEEVSYNREMHAAWLSNQE